MVTESYFSELLKHALESLRLQEMDPDALIEAMAAMEVTYQLGKDPVRVGLAEILSRNVERLGWAHHHQTWTVEAWKKKATNTPQANFSLVGSLYEQYSALLFYSRIAPQEFKSDLVLVDRLEEFQKALLDNREKLQMLVAPHGRRFNL